MFDLDTQARALATLTEDGVLHGLRVMDEAELIELRRWSVASGVEGEITVEGHTLRVRVGVDKRFPLSLV